jgi:hypothetical protein
VNCATLPGMTTYRQKITRTAEAVAPLDLPAKVLYLLQRHGEIDRSSLLSQTRASAAELNDVFDDLSELGKIEMYLERSPNSTKPRVVVALPGMPEVSNAPGVTGDAGTSSIANTDTLRASPTPPPLIEPEMEPISEPMAEFEGKTYPQSVIDEIKATRADRPSVIVDWVMAQVDEMQDEPNHAKE